MFCLNRRLWLAISTYGKQRICRCYSASTHFHVSWLSDFIFYPKPLYQSLHQCLNRRLWLAIQIFVCLFICKSFPMIHCGNRSFLVVTWQMFEKWKTNVEIIGSKAKSCWVRDSSVVRRHYILLLEPSDVRELCIRKTADLLLQLCYL
jgi:hypothetical protein